MRLKRDTIGPHFRHCIPKWGKRAAGAIHLNSRVEVKFHDESEEGFTWYPGTVVSKTSAGYGIAFDNDEGRPWTINAKQSCYRLLDDGIKSWARRVGRLVPGTRLEVCWGLWAVGVVVAVAVEVVGVGLIAVVLLGWGMPVLMVIEVVVRPGALGRQRLVRCVWDLFPMNILQHIVFQLSLNDSVCVSHRMCYRNPLCDIPSGCCSFTGPWTVTRSSLRMLRRVAAFCRPLRPVLLLVSFPRSRSPVVGVLGLC